MVLEVLAVTHSCFHRSSEGEIPEALSVIIAVAELPRMRTAHSKPVDLNPLGAIEYMLRRERRRARKVTFPIISSLVSVKSSRMHGGVYIYTSDCKMHSRNQQEQGSKTSKNRRLDAHLPFGTT
jgi:hypothetical protein